MFRPIVRREPRWLLAGVAVSLLYVFVIDPAVKGADYTVSNILADAYEPAELNEIFKTYAASYASGQNIVNLTLITALGSQHSAQ